MTRLKAIIAQLLGPPKWAREALTKLAQDRRRRERRLAKWDWILKTGEHRRAERRTDQ